MSIECCITGFGSFSSDLSPYLDYPEDCYKDMLDGLPILVNLFFTHTKSESSKLATILGTSLWDFNNHSLSKSKINWEELRKFNQEESDRLELFLLRGFTMFFNLDA